MNSKNYDVIIIGAGASGMLAAHFCSLSQSKILVLDHNKSVGKKILISGGGKCNFTNMYGEFSDYQSQNPHFVKSALSRYTVWDFLELIDKYEIPYEERNLGKLFCKRSAKDINSMLLSLLNKDNIDLKLNMKDLDVSKNEKTYTVFNKEGSFQTSNLIIATGGLVLPSIGASSFGHVIAKRYGHKIIPTSPALVPFIVPGFDHLKGNAFVAGISCNGFYFEENVLFTHKGLSGPGILKTSLNWNPGDSIEVNWLPRINLLDLLEKIDKKLQINTILRRHFPNNFADHILKINGVEGKTYLGKLSQKKIHSICSSIHKMKITPQGSEGFRKAEVTKGGIDTRDISSKTMESKLSPGLYFIGEVVDVTGQLGGHNFQWCWASAYAVSQAIAK